MTGANRQQVTFRSVISMSNAARAAKGLPTRGQERISKAAEIAKFEPIQSNSCLVATPVGYPGRYPIFSVGDFAQRDPPQWIVKGVFPKAEVGVVFGSPGSGKSFFVLDLALNVALGRQWRGRRVKPLRILYLAAEGGGGVALRLRAYAEHHGVDLAGIKFGVMNSQPNFLVEDDVGEVVRAIVAAGGADLIIVDTLAQVTPGANENGAEDMGKALANARQITSATGAMVLLVHHSGKDQSRGARGWSGLRAAADVEIEVSRTDDMRCAKVTKLKDGEDGDEFHFLLEQIHLGFDRDGDAITSVVVEPVDPPPREEKVKLLGKNQRTLKDAIEDLQTFVEGPVEVETVLARVLELIPYDPGADPENPLRDQRRTNINKTLKGMVSAGLVHQSGSQVSLQPIAVNDDEGGVV